MDSGKVGRMENNNRRTRRAMPEMIATEKINPIKLAGYVSRGTLFCLRIAG